MRILKTALMLLLVMAISHSKAQNRYNDVIPFEQLDGNIILKTSVNNLEYKFLVDTKISTTVISADKIADMGISSQQKAQNLFITGDTIIAVGLLPRMTIGKNIFVENQKVNVIKSKYLKDNNIAGIIGLKPFLGYVLTINKRDKTITTTTPYKPDYIHVKNKAPLTSINGLELAIVSKNIPFIFDFSGQYFMSLSGESFALLKDSLKPVTKRQNIPNSKLYHADNFTETEQAELPFFKIANKEFSNVTVFKNKSKYSFIGSQILDYGVLSLDINRQTLYLEPYETLTIPQSTKDTTKAVVVSNPEKSGKVVSLDRNFFLEHICNYRSSAAWKYLGDKPAIIDFWAPWCVPCRQLGPIVEQLANEYGDKVTVFKLNIDEEPEIANYFKITSIPVLMYVPMNGQPLKRIGLQTKEQIKKIIDEELLKK